MNKTIPKNTRRAFIVSTLISYGLSMIEDKDYELTILNKRIINAREVYKYKVTKEDYNRDLEIANYIWNLNNNNKGIILNYDEMPYFIMMAGSLLPTKDYYDFLKLKSFITDIRLSKEKEKLISDSVIKANEVLKEKLNIKSPISLFVPKREFKVKKERDRSKKSTTVKKPKKNVSKFIKNKEKKDLKRKSLLKKKIRKAKRLGYIKNTLLLLSKNHNSYSKEIIYQ